MNYFATAALTGALLCASALSFAASHTGAPAAAAATDAKPMMHDAKSMHDHHMMNMKQMDTNGDGLISKEEFMKAHEKMFDAMPKNKDGLVDMNAMGMMGKKK